MEKEFVPYEQALTLKELGFDEPCFGFHSKIHGLMMVKTSGSSSLYKDAGECLSPTFSQAFRWFRDKYNLLGSIDYSNRLKWYYVIREVITSNTFHNHSTSNKEDFNTYEEAEFQCIQQLIEIVKEK